MIPLAPRPVILALISLAISALLGSPSPAALSLNPDYRAGAQYSQPIYLHYRNPVPPRPRSINIVTGVPLTSIADLTGGFGDIAANVAAAFEFKKRDPSLDVRVLVTSLTKRQTSQVRTTDEILKIMLPDLKPELKGEIQELRGVKFIFLSLPTERLVFENALNQEIANDWAKQIPKADLSLQLSANSNPMNVALRINSRLAISAHEPDAYAHIFNDVIPAREDLPFATKVHIMAGAYGAGFYLEKSSEQSADDRAMIRETFKSKFGIELDKTTKILFAYSKEWSSAKTYLIAAAEIAKAHPQQQFVIITKSFSQNANVELPANLRVGAADSFSHDFTRAMIRESDYAPLVTGDVSLSLALSSSNERKTLVYEMPPWKEKSGRDVQGALAFKLNVDVSTLSPLFIKADNEIVAEDIRFERAQRLAQVLLDQSLQARTHHALRELGKSWDLFANVLRTYDMYSKYQVEWDSGLSRIGFDDFVIKLLKKHGHWRGAIAEARAKLVAGKATPAAARRRAAFLLLKFDDHFSRELRGKVASALLASDEWDEQNQDLQLLLPILKRPEVKRMLQLFDANSDQWPQAQAILDLLRTWEPELDRKLELGQSSNGLSCKAALGLPPSRVR